MAVEGGPAGSRTLDQFEASVQQENRRDEAGSELGARLSILAATGSTIPVGGAEGTTPTISPPLGGGGTGSIEVRGTLDAN